MSRVGGKMEVVLQRISKHALVLPFLFALIITVWLIKGLLEPSSCKVWCDSALADTIQNRISQLITLPTITDKNVSELYRVLRKEFPIIQSVAVRYSASGNADIYVEAHRIVIRLKVDSCEYGMAHNGEVIPLDLFHELYWQDMPIIEVESQSETQYKALHKIAFLLQKLFLDYRITWHSESCIVLNYRHEAITIVADIYNVQQSSKFSYVHAIYQSKREMYKVGMKADIRFKDCVICSSLRGR